MARGIVKKVTMFLKQDENRLGVVSTVTDDCSPQSAFVYYTFDKELNIYFVTRAGTSKYKNTVRNRKISFVIAIENPPQTLQVEGMASVVTDPKQQKKLWYKVHFPWLVLTILPLCHMVRSANF